MEVAIKVVVVGNGAAGKSSMIQRYCKGIFTKDYKKTNGVDFLERQIHLYDEDVRLMLWETAGQEEFDAITKAYYRGVFNTADGSHSGQNSNGLNGSGDVINLRPNKQRTKKTKSPFTNCSFI